MATTTAGEPELAAAADGCMFYYCARCGMLFLSPGEAEAHEKLSGHILCILPAMS